MKVLDLFSGIGGFSLGLERAGMTTVAFCEVEDFPRKVLAKHWPDVPCYPDIRELTKEVLIDDGILADTDRERCGETRHTKDRRRTGGGCTQNQTNGTSPATIDLICGGYPCQPFSAAGKRAGAEDDRHLWPEMYRLIEAIKPQWVLAENVAGHISMGLDDVLSDLENAGYAWWTFVIPACAVDAKHRRDRVWIVANSESNGRQQGQQDSGRRAAGNGPREESGFGDGCGTVAHPRSKRTQRPSTHDQDAQRATIGGAESGGGCEVVADPTGSGQPRQGKSVNACNQTPSSEGQAIDAVNVSQSRLWPTEPAVGRVAHGIPQRVDRLKSLGNAVVPQVVEEIGRAIMAAA